MNKSPKGNKLSTLKENDSKEDGNIDIESALLLSEMDEKEITDLQNLMQKTDEKHRFSTNSSNIVIEEKKELPNFEELNKTILKLQHENEALQSEKEFLLKNQSKYKPQPKKNLKKFWDGLRKRSKLKWDPDQIKEMIRKKKINVFDVNVEGRTLLIEMVRHGLYEMVELTLNLGADPTHKDESGKMAIDYARKYTMYHIEQLLLFNSMNASASTRLNALSEEMNKQKGITENIMIQLAFYKNKKLFKDILIDLMIKIISKKLAFSDDLLNICWKLICVDNDNPLSSNLWKTLVSTCNDIIVNHSKRDWYYFKTFIVPSTIWFEKIPSGFDDEKHDEKEALTKNKNVYMYSLLLLIVNRESKNQLNKLESDLNILANKNLTDWDILTKWIAEKDENNEIQPRQNLVPNCIEPKYTHSQLIQLTGSSKFSATKFYDYYQYLPQLVLLAEFVDDPFQHSVQKIFNIDKNTKSAIQNGGEIRYMRGPVKLIERARNKAENDYSNENYPTSACVLDLNRCSLIFNDISTLLYCLKLFVNKVKYYQSGNIIGIARVKNGFFEYVKEVQYSDIKLNVLIKGKRNNIIGEIQFLLIKMMDYKNVAHNLYGIQREQEYVELSVTNILPLLLDEDKQTFIAGNMNDRKQLCSLMAVNNKTEKDIMKISKETGETMLTPVCKVKQEKMFIFLKQIINRDLFIDRLFHPDTEYDRNPIEFAVKARCMSIIKHIFNIDKVIQRYRTEHDMLFKMLFCLWRFCDQKDEYVIDYVMGKLDISNKLMGKMMSHPYDTPGRYGVENIMSSTCMFTDVYIVKKLKNVIGEKVFAESVLNDDAQNRNTVECIIENRRFHGKNKNQINILKYIFTSIKQVKHTYMNDDNLLFRLLYWLFVSCKDEDMMHFMVNELNINSKKIVQLINYKHKLNDSNTKKLKG
eukprot:484653_1